MEEQRTIFQRIHREGFRWMDLIIIQAVLAFVLTLVGQLTGAILVNTVRRALGIERTDFVVFFNQYLGFIGIWIIVLLYCLISKRNRPVIKAVGIRPKGNRIRFLLLGCLIGFLMNGASILAAFLNKDIHLYFDSFRPGLVLLILAAVLIQSGAEELTCRGFLYQKLRKGYRHPAVAIVANALCFSLFHIFNPGVTVMSLVDIFLSGLIFSLCVYYMDSLWCAIGIHAGWNYTQSIIFGLPNSGIVSQFSIFKLEASSARDSIFYNVAFGVEGTVFSVIVLIVVLILLFLWGRKHGTAPLDVWAKQA